MTELLYRYIRDPRNARYNYDLGRWYELEGHTAAGVSFYLRCAELSVNSLLVYECLIRAARCIYFQGNRAFIVKGLLQRAVSVKPRRPEALFLLCKLYEENKEYSDAYYLACMGESLIEEPEDQLINSADFPGKYGFTFERAISAWWIGLYDESLHLLRELRKNPGIDGIYRASIDNNLSRLVNNWRESIAYDSYLYEYLKIKFPGAETIKKNYAQCYQDIFALTMLNGKRNGRFLEIGCGFPHYGNNTALLEEFGWTGIAIDDDPERTKLWLGKRAIIPITQDALTVDYGQLMGSETDWDYLQVDLHPPAITFEALKKIPLEKYRFAVITFEHDHYCDEFDLVRNKSRAYFESFGYVLMVGDIAPDNWSPFEDWWVHPDLVDIDAVYTLFRGDSGTIKPDDYMLNKLY